MSTNPNPCEKLIEDAIRDHPEIYTALHKTLASQALPFEDLAKAARPLAVGRMAAMRCGRVTVPWRGPRLT